MIARPWEGYIEPFRLAGNVYFVGTVPASAHLIDTGDGLILLDSGYPQTLYLVLDGIWRLGFDPQKIRYILHSHGHYDHLGATRALTALTGARTVIGRADVPLANGSLDLSWARELGHAYYEAFEPDIALDDGDVLELGNVRIEAVVTPGHTPGTMSYFFPIETEQGVKLAGMFGGAGLNTLDKAWLLKNGQPFSCRAQLRESVERVRARPVEVYLGNHVNLNHTLDKAAILRRGGENPFIDPAAWGRSLDKICAALACLTDDPAQW